MNIIEEGDLIPSVALVVFSDRTAIGWLRILKRGFRHCALVLHGRNGWLLCDSLAHRVVLDTIEDAALVDLLVAATRRGDRVLVLPMPPEPPWRIRRARPFTCVELCVRALGLPAKFVLTPFQLFRYLSIKFHIKD